MTARQIRLEVCAAHGVTPAQIAAKSNRAVIVAARNEAMARCRVELRMSFALIGRLFGKDHSTVMHGVNKYLAADTARFDPAIALARLAERGALPKRRRRFVYLVGVGREDVAEREGLMKGD